ncbi:hypothetical protein [Nocardia flavorosea]|uniref:hypothetical protein n=1 Tax=Nocardia flavorosea TaxID=53429 RepID=UPI002457713D|nr:hypothetical protein [Nocardia flavorosea]
MTFLVDVPGPPCIAVDDPNPHRVFNALLVRSEVAYALGYGTGEAGTLAVILPDDDGRPQLRFARIPADFPADHVIELERVPDEQIPVAAHLIGHALPAWTEKEITRNGIAAWEPQQWAPEHWRDGEPVPIELAVPRELTAAHTFRRHAHAQLEAIEAGTITTPRDVPASLRGLVYRAWEAPLLNMRRRPNLIPGWSWLFRLPPAPDTNWPTEEMDPALRWLATNPEASPIAAKIATRYFGYQASVAISVLDLTTLTPAARSALEKALFQVYPDMSWLTSTLETHLQLCDFTGEFQHFRWGEDPDPQSHPILRAGDTIAFHIPRALFPISTPDYAEVTATTLLGSTYYCGFIVDIDGNLTPIPIRPDSRESVGAALTAAVWAPTAHLAPGAQHIVGNTPLAVQRLTALLQAGEPLHLDWDELATTTGPGPGPHADWQDLLTWREGDPTITP